MKRLRSRRWEKCEEHKIHSCLTLKAELRLCAEEMDVSWQDDSMSLEGGEGVSMFVLF